VSREWFFAIACHGIPATLVDDLQGSARTFFALPDDRKLAIARGFPTLLNTLRGIASL